MKTHNFETREEWLEFRKGRITGSRLKDIITKRGNGTKIGVYELIAERVAVEPDGENAMERGSRLEEEGMQRFIEETGKEVDTSLVIWTSDENEHIAVSPDGFIGETEAVEIKCLGSASHIEAWLTQKIPNEYEDQVTQYFIVNEKLEQLHFCFYDPRIPAKPFFYFTIHRKDREEDITKYLEYQKEVLDFVQQAVLDLTF